MTGFPAFSALVNSLRFLSNPKFLAVNAQPDYFNSRKYLRSVTVGQNDVNCHFDSAAFCELELEIAPAASLGVPFQKIFSGLPKFP